MKRDNFFVRWYWHLVYLTKRYQNILNALFLGIIFILLLQLWNQITAPIEHLNTDIQVNGIKVIMRYPEKIYVGEKYSDTLKFKLDDQMEIPKDTEISITIDDAEGSLTITSPDLEITSDNKEEDTEFYYDSPEAQDSVLINTKVTVGDGVSENLEKRITVEDAPAEFLVSIMTLITAIAAFVNLILQFRKLFSKET